MQERHARQLRQEWGDKVCGHPAFDHLTLGSIHDGYVCIRCGQEFTQEQRDLLLTNRKAKVAEAKTAADYEGHRILLRSARVPLKRSFTWYTGTDINIASRRKLSLSGRNTEGQ